MGLIRGGEIRQPKSWGNGYFRFSLLDLIKIGVALFALSGAYYGIIHKLDNNSKDIKQVKRQCFEAGDSLSKLVNLKFDTRDRQLRYLWEESKIDHDILWKAIRRQNPKRDIVYMGGWELGPNGWEPKR